MNGRVSQIPLDLAHKDLHLLLLPSQHAREQCRRVRVDDLQLLDGLVAPDFLESGVLGPRSDGDLTTKSAHPNSATRNIAEEQPAKSHLENILMNIHKPRLDQLILPQRRAVDALAKLAGALAQQLHPAVGVYGVGGGAVVGDELCVDTLQLEPAARDEVLEGLLIEVVVVGDAALELARVDVVKGRVVEPLSLEVVDLEGAVGGGPGGVSGLSRLHSCRYTPFRLDWAQISSDDFSRRMRTAKWLEPDSPTQVLMDEM